MKEKNSLIKRKFNFYIKDTIPTTLRNNFIL